MFGYGLVCGYVLTSTIHHHSDKGIITFQIAFDKYNKKTIFCRIQDGLTIAWFRTHFETGKFAGKLILARGHFDSKEYKFKGSNIRNLTLVVECIEFTDFTAGGFNAVDSGHFYDRNMLDWETYFNKETDDFNGR